MVYLCSATYTCLHYNLLPVLCGGDFVHTCSHCISAKCMYVVPRIHVYSANLWPVNVAGILCAHFVIVSVRGCANVRTYMQVTTFCAQLRSTAVRLWKRTYRSV